MCCLPAAAEGKLYLLEMLEALEMLEVMRRVLLSMLELMRCAWWALFAVNGRLYSLGCIRWR